jgi:hypothetical protein
MPPAGWYADPRDATKWRYWDGAQWTDHVAPRLAQPRPEDALAEERKWAVWARWAFLAYVPASIASAALLAAYYESVYDGRLFARDAPQPDFFESGGLALAVQAVGFLTLGLMFVMAMWTYQAARTAKALGIPLRRQPGWALAGWFVPIVNLWFPPTSIRSFAPERSQLRIVVEWWACYIVGVIAMVVGGLAIGGADIAAGAPFLVVGLVGQIAFALLGTHLVRMVREIHEQMVEQRAVLSAGV